VAPPREMALKAALRSGWGRSSPHTPQRGSAQLVSAGFPGSLLRQPVCRTNPGENSQSGNSPILSHFTSASDPHLCGVPRGRLVCKAALQKSGSALLKRDGCTNCSHRSGRSAPKTPFALIKSASRLQLNSAEQSIPFPSHSHRRRAQGTNKRSTVRGSRGGGLFCRLCLIPNLYCRSYRSSAACTLQSLLLPPHRRRGSIVSFLTRGCPCFGPCSSPQPSPLSPWRSSAL